MKKPTQLYPSNAALRRIYTEVFFSIGGLLDRLAVKALKISNRANSPKHRSTNVPLFTQAFPNFKETNIIKDPEMLQRLHDLKGLKHDEQTHILFAFDSMLRDAKTRRAYAK